MALLRKPPPPPTTDELAARLDVLGTLDIFEGAQQDELATLAGAIETVEIPAGRDIVRQGRLPTHFYVVKEGDLDVLSTGERAGLSQRVNTLTAGDSFGEIGLLEGMPSTATVRTETACTLYRIKGADFLAAIDSSPTLSESLAEKISGSLARTHPSYRPATETDAGGSSPLAKEAGALFAVLDDDEADLVVAWLRTLRRLDAAERRRALKGLADRS